MAITPETLIVTMLVVFVGYTIFGATGFGASPITIPVLAHVLPLTFVLSLAALLDLSSVLLLGFHFSALVRLWRRQILGPRVYSETDAADAPTKALATTCPRS